MEGIDWGYWVWQATWNITLALIATALFEWLGKPVYRNMFGPERQRLRSRKRQDGLLKAAALGGTELALLHILILVFVLPMCASLAIIVVSIFVERQFPVDFSGLPRIGSESKSELFRLLWNLIGPIASGLIIFTIFRNVRDVAFVISIHKSFRNTLEFIGPYATRKEILELRSAFVAMENTDQARAINLQLLEIAKKAGKVIPWHEGMVFPDL